MAKSYTEVEIIADEELNEQLIAILSQLGFEGFWEEGTRLRCFINRDKWSDAMYVELENVVHTIHRSSASGVPTISVTNVDDKNWNEEWEKTIQPIHVTERIVITPTWHNYQAQNGEIVLTIDPKMSFGTGYHETTRLVLKLMEKYVQSGMRLLDVGTGTGVLAIAGIKLGAVHAVGVDNDEWSYTNAVENAALNHVEDKISLALGELASVQESGFDMIVANIQRNVIEPLFPALKGKLQPGGVLVLSGLLKVDGEPMTRAIADSGMWIAETAGENEWLAYCVKRESASE